MVFRWFPSFSLVVPKAPTAIGITVALTSPNFCTCNLNSWYLVISSSSFTLMFWSPGTARSMILHSLFYLSMTTISSLRCSISLICFDCKVLKYFTFVIFQHYLWLMPEPFVFTFNLKFLSQEPVCFFSKFIVSRPVLVSS